MSFEFDARRYQRTSAHQQEWGQRLIAELDLQGYECILDVGSGDGSLTRKLAAGVPRGSVLGLDASAQMVAAAQELQGPNLRFVRMEPTVIPSSRGIRPRKRRGLWDGHAESVYRR